MAPGSRPGCASRPPFASGTPFAGVDAVDGRWDRDRMNPTAEPRTERVPDEDELLSVVYSSVASGPFSDADLALLLAISRMNNESRGLTGLLLHRGGQFMQALEGPASAVRAALRTIAADPRHSGVWTLAEERITERRFGSWAMGYQPISDRDLAEAPSWFGSPEALAERAGSRAAELLTWFRAR